MSNESTSTSDDFDEYASLALAAAGLVVAADGSGKSRQIQCATAGTLVVKQGKGGTTKTLTFAAGESKPIVCVAIVEAGSSGCVPVTVYR